MSLLKFYHYHDYLYSIKLYQREWWNFNIMWTKIIQSDKYAGENVEWNKRSRNKTAEYIKRPFASFMFQVAPFLERHYRDISICLRLGRLSMSFAVLRVVLTVVLFPIHPVLTWIICNYTREKCNFRRTCCTTKGEHWEYVVGGTSHSELQQGLHRKKKEKEKWHILLIN